MKRNSKTSDFLLSKKSDFSLLSEFFHVISVADIKETIFLFVLCHSVLFPSTPPSFPVFSLRHSTSQRSHRNPHKTWNSHVLHRVLYLWTERKRKVELTSSQVPLQLNKQKEDHLDPNRTPRATSRNSKRLSSLPPL